MSQPLFDFQQAPDTDWTTWLIAGARGGGRTYAAAQYAIRHLRELGARAVVSLLAKTTRDAFDTVLGAMVRAGEEFETVVQEHHFVHARGGEVRVVGEKTAAWLTGWRSSLIVIDNLDQLMPATYEVARKSLRLRRATGARKGSNVAGQIVATTQKLAETQIVRFGRDWVKEIADDEWTVVTLARPEVIPGYTVPSMIPCPTCGVSIVETEMIAHDINQHEGMRRVVGEHAKLCGAGPCACSLRSYEAIYNQL